LKKRLESVFHKQSSNPPEDSHFFSQPVLKKAQSSSFAVVTQPSLCAKKRTSGQIEANSVQKQQKQVQMKGLPTSTSLHAPLDITSPKSVKKASCKIRGTANIAANSNQLGKLYN